MTNTYDYYFKDRFFEGFAVIIQVIIFGFFGLLLSIFYFLYKDYLNLIYLFLFLGFLFVFGLFDFNISLILLPITSIVGSTTFLLLKRKKNQ